MPVLLSKDAREKSTYIVEATFRDEIGQPVDPVSVVWTLTTAGGVVINSRENVSISPANPVNIVLKGDDLAILTADGGAHRVLRIVTVAAVYNSTYGNSLPLIEPCFFYVRNSRAVS